MAAGKLTDQECARIREAHAEGVSLGHIAAELGRSKSTVSNWCRRHNLTYDSTRTRAAAEAVTATNQEKRARLETRFLDEAANLLDELHRPHLAYNFGGKENTYAEHELPEPDITGKKALIQAAGTAVDKAVKLAEVDKASTGAQAGKSMVGALFAALAVTPIEDPETAE
jgi:transposase-like protein